MLVPQNQLGNEAGGRILRASGGHNDLSECAPYRKRKGGARLRCVRLSQSAA